MISSLTREESIVVAKRLLNRARKDHRAFEKLVGDINLPIRHRQSIDSALGVYLLQQSCEKTVKAVAIGSRQFSPEKLRREYGHDSLRLWIDLYLKLLNIPAFAQSITIIKSRLGTKADKLKTAPEALATLETVKRNTRKYKDRPADVQDWLTEFANLPPDQFGQVVSMLRKLHHNLASGIFELLEPNIEINLPSLKRYMEEPTTDNLIAALAPSFRKKTAHGEDFNIAVELMKVFMGKSFDQALAEAAAKTELLDHGVTFVKIGKRAVFEKRILSGFALSALMFVAAFTFPHEQSSRYPRLTDSGADDDLDCDSYATNLGIVSCLYDLGHLIGLTLSDIDEMVNMIGDLFDQFPVSGSAETNNQTTQNS